jgi:hypothetical protein
MKTRRLTSINATCCVLGLWLSAGALQGATPLPVFIPPLVLPPPPPPPAIGSTFAPTTLGVPNAVPAPIASLHVVDIGRLGLGLWFASDPRYIFDGIGGDYIQFRLSLNFVPAIGQGNWRLYLVFGANPWGYPPPLFIRMGPADPFYTTVELNFPSVPTGSYAYHVVLTDAAGTVIDVLDPHLVFGAGSGPTTEVLTRVNFAHDYGLGIPPPPENAVFDTPDPADVFGSATPIDLPSPANFGNSLVRDNVELGLVPGDRIDALDRPGYAFLTELGVVPSPRLYFSVRQGAQGEPGSAVHDEAPFNQADVYVTTCNFTNRLSVTETQLGLLEDAVGDDGVHGLWFPEFGESECLLFSLAPGSPTLSIFEASPADIFVVTPGPFASPDVAFSATDLGLNPATDNVDALVVLSSSLTNCGLGGDAEVLFSVKAGAVGLPRSAVAQAAAAGSVGAFVFSSTGAGDNKIYCTPDQLGLLATDDVDALEYREDSILPCDEPGAIEPPVGPSGYVGTVRLSRHGRLIEGAPQQPSRLEIRLACGGAVERSFLLNFAGTPSGEGDSAAELRDLAAALRTTTCPCDGRPLFSSVHGPCPEVRDDAELFAVLAPDSPCRLTSLVWEGPEGRGTKDAALVPFLGGALTAAEGRLRVYGGATQTREPAQFILRLPGQESIVADALPGETPGDLVATLAQELARRGYDASASAAELVLHRDPSGRAVTSVEEFGLAEGSSDLGWTTAVELDTKLERFVYGQQLGLPGVPTHAASGDLDGDGDVDLAVAVETGPLVLLKNQGNATFSEHALLAGLLGPVHVAIDDLNGDARTDLVVALAAESAIAVFPNQGGGVFGTPTRYEVRSAQGRPLTPSAVATGDHDRDGDIDLAVGTYENDTVVLFRNDLRRGVLTAGGQVVATRGEPQNGGLRLAAADLDRDGSLDLAVVHPGRPSLAVLKLDREGNFEVAGEHAVGQSPRSLAVADLDGDGYLDLITANTNSHDLSVLRNDRRGSFLGAQILRFPRNGSPQSVDAADLDGDGDEDLVVANSFTSDAAVFLNDAAGRLVLARSIEIPLNPELIAAADLNGDGAPDLVTVSRNARSLQVLRNQDPTAPSADVTPPVIQCPDPIAAECAGSEGAVVEFEVEASDNSGLAPAVTCAPPSGSVFPLGTTVVACAATDAAGNRSECGFEVTVRCGIGQSPGDCNQDGSVDLSDAICLFGYLFRGRPPTLPCADAASVLLMDWNGDGQIDISDGIALLTYFFRGGADHATGLGSLVCWPIVGCPGVCFLD